MDLKNNPIFQLASKVEDGLMSPVEAAEYAYSPKFFEKIKKKHFMAIIKVGMSSFVYQEPSHVPRTLFLLATICAARRRNHKGIFGYIAVHWAFVLIEEMEPREALEFLERALVIARRKRDSNSVAAIRLFVVWIGEHGRRTE